MRCCQEFAPLCRQLYYTRSSHRLAFGGAMLLVMRLHRLLVLSALALAQGADEPVVAAASTDEQAALRLHATAKELINSGKYADALAPELKASALDPDNASIHGALTAIYERTNRPADA